MTFEMIELRVNSSELELKHAGVVDQARMHYQNGDPFTGIAVCPDGSDSYLLDGKLHRLDGPALSFKDGYQAWYKHGIRHRIGGPALIDPGMKMETWYEEGKEHRRDGPAIIYENGDVEWWLYGAQHSLEAWAEILNIYGTDEFTMLKLEYGT